MRIKILRVVIIVAFFWIALNLVYVQVIRGQYFYNLSKNNRIRIVASEGRRGRIFDRNGTILADNRVAFNVLVIPQEIKDKEELFGFLSASLGVNEEKLLKKYRQKLLGAFAPITLAEDIPRETAIVLEENKFRFPGLFMQESFRRFYPGRETSAHAVGYVGKINVSRIEKFKEYGYTAQSIVGYSGVEEFYDPYLKGEEGGLQIEVDSRGQQVRLLSFKEALQGQDLTLSIDDRIQRLSTELMAARPGALIVMDLETGEVLGLISSPSYDPNIFIQNTRAESAAVFSNPQSPLINRAVGGQFPPGSVFKLPVALGALETQKITPHTTFHCPGFFELGTQQFRCAHIHGDQDLIQAIAHSCNVYFNHVGLTVGPDVIGKYALMLNLGQPTKIDLPYEAKGLVPGRYQKKNKEPWYKGDTVNLSIGQGDTLATPVQLIQMMATIARNGKEIQPHLIKSIGGREIVYASQKRPVQLKEKTWEAVQQGLRATITEPTGTAHILDLPGVEVFGKTGTAQSSKGKEDHSWFVGYGISQRGKIAFCVFLEHGGSSYNACLTGRDLLMKLQEQEIL